MQTARYYDSLRPSSGESLLRVPPPSCPGRICRHPCCSKRQPCAPLHGGLGCNDPAFQARLNHRSCNAMRPLQPMSRPAGAPGSCGSVPKRRPGLRIQTSGLRVTGSLPSNGLGHYLPSPPLASAGRDQCSSPIELSDPYQRHYARCVSMSPASKLPTSPAHSHAFASADARIQSRSSSAMRLPSPHDLAFTHSLIPTVLPPLIEHGDSLWAHQSQAPISPTSPAPNIGQARSNARSRIAVSNLIDTTLDRCGSDMSPHRSARSSTDDNTPASDAQDRQRECSTSPRLWTCQYPGCDRIYSTAAGLRYHLKAFHQTITQRAADLRLKPKRYCCKICRKTFVTGAGLRYHHKTTKDH
ncbi:uncharacterized protein BJ171DRAFT_486623 [Polychytrium aggregatum]|uniref:uncharacterized protein n=1 Tax=Polychytrium aggregatum TaxID=110093 RepID=UPI0022FDBF88|nr:uncharacterized protein BJ171DRAFT_486623 [Polychytrium aggregatum]KAI9209367.1 hypothetical protein BJ171DRAFT_486623 [Polychytrium aggregatum]